MFKIDRNEATVEKEVVMLSRLEVNIKLAVKPEAHKVDKSGLEEIYLRGLVSQIQNLIEFAGRDKLEYQTTYEITTTNRRPSKRKPKTKRSLR